MPPPNPFTHEELDLARTAPITPLLLRHSGRMAIRALSEFGHEVLEPAFATALNPTDRELAIGTTFYRLIGVVRTLGDLSESYSFQTMAGATRTIFELCVDVHLLAGDKIERGIEKFHGFTKAARFSLAYTTVAFFKDHPDWEEPGDVDERRAAIEQPGAMDEITALCQGLWATRKAPPHWSGLRWSQQIELLDRTMQTQYARWADYWAWLVHGGGAGVGGLPVAAFESIEIILRQTVKDVVPETYRLIGVGMHMHRAYPAFFDELHAVRDLVETYALIDAQLQSLGRPSKFARANQ